MDVSVKVEPEELSSRSLEVEHQTNDCRGSGHMTDVRSHDQRQVT